MKVFISWSGEPSLGLAVVLREWLPNVVQAIQPYVSSEDIDKGARWATDISKELEGSSFGVLAVTPGNIDAPWLNFEAGALSKSFDSSHVSPFLLGVTRAEVRGPLLQFQSVIAEKDDVLKLIKTLNAACGEHAIAEDRLGHVFETWWPQLEAELKTLLVGLHGGEAASERNSDDQSVLEEILELVRIQQRTISDPKSLLPVEYIDFAVQSSRELRTKADERGSIAARRDLMSTYGELAELVRHRPDDADLSDWFDDIGILVDRLARPVRYFSRSPGSRTERPRPDPDDAPF